MARGLKAYRWLCFILMLGSALASATRASAQARSRGQKQNQYAIEKWIARTSKGRIHDWHVVVFVDQAVTLVPSQTGYSRSVSLNQAQATQVTVVSGRRAAAQAIVDAAARQNFALEQLDAPRRPGVLLQQRDVMVYAFRSKGQAEAFRSQCLRR